jgi:hypothetical protein
MKKKQQLCARCQQPLTPEDVGEQRGWCEACRSSPIVPPNPTATANIAEAYSSENPDRPTFVDLAKVKTYHFHRKSFDTEAIMQSIRHAGWPNKEFFLNALLSSPDGRWFARGGLAASRQEWQTQVREKPAFTELAQVTPEQAARILIRAGFDLPPDLTATVQAIAMGGKPPRSAEPPNQSAAGEDRGRVTATPPAEGDQTNATPVSGTTISPQCDPSVQGTERGLDANSKPINASPELLETTAIMLGRAVKQVELVRFLAIKEGQQAELTTIVKEFYKHRIVNEQRLKSARKLAERARDSLTAKNCPLRLHISGNVVRLIDVDPIA